MKNRGYKILSLIVVIATLLNVAFSSIIAVFATNGVDPKKVENLAIRAVDQRNLMAAFKYCYENAALPYLETPIELVTAGDPNYNEKLKNNIYDNEKTKSIHKDNNNQNLRYTPYQEIKTNLFRKQGGTHSDYSSSTEVTVRTGSDIESKINKKSDGVIWCFEDKKGTNLTRLFLNGFIGEGASIDSLICDGKNNGLLSPRDGSTCSDALKSDESEYIKDRQSGLKYLRKIYDKWAKTNPYAEKFDNLGKNVDNPTLDYVAALDSYRKDCMSFSSNSESFSPTKEQKTYNYTISLVTPDGVSDVYPVKKAGESDGLSSSSAFSYAYPSQSLSGGKGSPKTCADLVHIINSNAPVYAKNFKTDKQLSEDNCLSEAKAIVDKYALIGDTPDGISKLTKAEQIKFNFYKQIVADLKSGKGSQETLKEKCLDFKKSGSTNEKSDGDKCLSQMEAYVDKYSTLAETPDGLTKIQKLTYDKYRAITSSNDDMETKKNKCLEILDVSPDEESSEWEDVPDYDESGTSSAEEEQKQSYCQENGGFLSWMLCPAIADGASTAGGLLGFITSLTTVHTSIIEQFSKQDSSIYKAWSAFRNIANIGFVIMLLVVVFSQVTNIGISNYNIKKILPKLIVTAILVNFSYLIIGVLIDLSQIAGNGIGALIRSIAADSMDADASARASATISAIAGAVTGVAGAAIGVAGVATGGAAIAGLVGGPAIILPVALFIITSLISVFFGFIMLTIRQAAIIMIIVLAPLMMVLYALPNTSAITKKYISTVKALLMLYPMFIFATSAGALASSIIIGTSTDLLMMIVGGLLNVLPYFAIPSMTSKSLAGLGAITGAFDKMRGGALKGASMAGGAIAASEFYKNVKSNYAADQSVARAKRDLRRFDKIKANGGELSIAQMRRQATAAGIVNNDSKLRAGSNSAGRGALSNMSGLGFENLKATAEKEFRDGEVKNIMNKLASDGVDEGTMESDLRSALGADYNAMTDEQKHANDIKIEALTRALGATKTGRKTISNIGQDTSLSTSNRAFTQLASAAVTLPGFADKQQIANRQFNEYLQNTSYKKNDEGLSSSLISATRSAGLDKAYDDMTMDNFLKVGNADADEILRVKGANSLDSVVSQTASAALNDANLIANFDKTKMSLVSAEMDNQRTSTINLRSGGTAQVFNPPSDFGEYSQVKNGAGEIIYTNKRGDSFNASTGQITKGV
jgi:hypothetical protein cdiviTM7_00597